MNSVLRPSFVPFDEREVVRAYRRNLPHWRQNGVTYFVTFRLADSITSGISRQWEAEKTAWLGARGISYDGERGTWHSAFSKLTAEDQFRFHQHFNRQVQACLDRGLGSCSLSGVRCLESVRKKLVNGDGVSYHLGDFVIMPNHVHLLVTPVVGIDLEKVLKQIKGAAAVECNRMLGREGAFWQAESYDHIVRSIEPLQAYRDYIADNPRKAGVTVPQCACYRATWMDLWFRAT